MQEFLKNNNLVLPLSEIAPLIVEAIEKGGEFHLVTAGTSMLPLLRNRTDTVVLKKANFPLVKYDIPLYKRESGQYVLHRVMRCHDGFYDMMGDNQLQLEKNVPESCIVAVVSRIMRDGKEIRFSSTLYKMYLLFWCRCLFIRRCVKKLQSVFLHFKKH